MSDLQRRWDERYAAAPVWSGESHPVVQEWLAARPAPPGASAADLGCGEGADALAMARAGYQTVGVDISPVALQRAAHAAADRAVSIEWVCQDLTRWTPTREFDLVAAAYVHGDTRDMHTVWASAASALASGGTLLLIGHAADELAWPAPPPGPPQQARFTADEARQVLGAWGDVSSRMLEREGRGAHAGQRRLDVVVEMTKR